MLWCYNYYEYDTPLRSVVWGMHPNKDVYPPLSKEKFASQQVRRGGQGYHILSSWKFDLPSDILHMLRPRLSVVVNGVNQWAEVKIVDLNYYTVKPQHD